MPKRKLIKKNKKQSDLEFDTSKVDEDAPSPLPSPQLGPPDARKRAESFSDDEEHDDIDKAKVKSSFPLIGGIGGSISGGGRPPLPPSFNPISVGADDDHTTGPQTRTTIGQPIGLGGGGSSGSDGGPPGSDSGPTGGHHRIVSSSDFSAMQLVRMRELLSPQSTDDDGGGEFQSPATIDENTPLVVPPSRVSYVPGSNKQRAESDLTDALFDLEGGHGHDSNSIIRNDGSDDDDRSDDDDDDENDDTRTFIGSIFTKGGSILEGTESIIEGAKTIIADIKDEAKDAWADYDDKCHYDWKDDWKGGGPIKFMRWIATGVATVDTGDNRSSSNNNSNNNSQSSTAEDDEQIQENLNNLARLLSLLREYHDRFGMPTKGGIKDQEYVLKECVRDLYLGGAPLWTLQPVMEKVAEGLTGQRGVQFFMLPRRAFIFTPTSNATCMFSITRGYDMQRLDAMESVAVRLASFASNTSGTRSIPTRWPKPQELRRAFRAESVAGGSLYKPSSKSDIADEILSLASESEGLFHFVNTFSHRGSNKASLPQRESSTRHTNGGVGGLRSNTELGDFWTVEDTTRELFCRLATIEAAETIDKIDVERKPLYSPTTVMLFRIGSSAGACAFWFNGSIIDVVISGVLAVMVAWIGNSPLLNTQERIIFEAVASFVVGLVSGIIALEFPNHTCFGAMAISGVLDLLQGFRVVYSIIEIMSRHCVTGAADFLEGVFFTALIAYFLRCGEYVASEFIIKPENDNYLQCTNPISEWWYLLVVPIAAISWSGLFNPHYGDLPFMAGHGILGYVVSWQFYKAAANNNMNNFLAAMAVTFSAGIISRFTGRQALGNTVAGLYVLLPGAYLVTTVFNDRIEGFLSGIILRAVIIGIGAWTGTILCSPTLLGVNRGLVNHSSGMPSLVEGSSSANFGSFASGPISTSSNSSGLHFRRRRDRKQGNGSLLLF